MLRSSVIVFCAAVAFAISVVVSARRRRTAEVHTLFWLSLAAAVAALCIWRGAIDELAHAMGIVYPPSAVFFLTCGGLGWLIYRLSLEVATQRQQIRRLAQEVAVLSGSIDQQAGRGGADGR